MFYNFPVIRHIDDVLPAIKDSPEFVVAEKDGYTVINYNVMMADTFPAILSAGNCEELIEQNIYYNKVRRECRGIIFDSATGNIVRRCYQKFFNVNEKPETQASVIDLSKRHTIYDKLDGSMIAPFYANGRLIFGTKMGDTDVAAPVNEFVKNNPQYIEFSKEQIAGGYTPIFEWCSRKQQIVLDYGNEDQLILVALRHMVSGEYWDYDYTNYIAYVNNIPVVKVFDPANDINEFIEYTRGLENVEGFVIDFNNGHKVKLKCDWYVQIHKAKEAILQDRNIVELILDEKLDDIKAHLQDDDRRRLDKFEADFNQIYLNLEVNLYFHALDYKKQCNEDRKTFAVNYAKNVDQFSKAGIFFLWDVCTRERAQQYVEKYIRSNIGKNVNWDQVAKDLFFGLKFN